MLEENDILNQLSQQIPKFYNTKPTQDDLLFAPEIVDSKDTIVLQEKETRISDVAYQAMEQDPNGYQCMLKTMNITDIEYEEELHCRHVKDEICHDV